MTSVNAIRFNRYQGAMLVDETMSTGDGQTYHVSDKVQPVIPVEVQEAYGMVGGLATTGSCSTGATLKQQFHDWILAAYRAEVEKAGQRPATFHDLDRLAAGLFDLMVRRKQQWMSERFLAEYGFDVEEFVAGKYERGGATVEIKDKDLIRRVTDWLSWKNQDPAVERIFLNAALFAGFDETNGVQIFHADFREGYWHRVQTCYFAEGSGRWSVDPRMYEFVERLSVDERRGNVEPVDGLIAMLAALNAASEHETGVGGYPSILLFDGKKPPRERQRELSDHRLWLASRVVRANTAGYLERPVCRELVDGLILGALDEDAAWQRFWASVDDKERLSRLLRGYKVAPRLELKP